MEVLKTILIFILCDFQPMVRGAERQIKDVNTTTFESQFHNCTISPIEQDIRDRLSTMLEDGKKLIFIHLTFHDMAIFPEVFSGDLFKPMDWVRSSGRYGRHLLFLRPHFEYLSMTTLSFETEHINVILNQKPNGCLQNYNVTTIESRLRQLLLSDFREIDGGGSLSEHGYICNSHIQNQNSRALFYYVCCHKGPDGNLFCQDLLYDQWIFLVFVCMFLINFIVIMYSPYLIPPSLYRKKFGYDIYEHALLNPLEIKIKKVAIVNDLMDTNSNAPHVHTDKLRGMPKLHKFLTTNLPMNNVLNISLNKIDISVKHSKLLPPNYVPIGILQTFYSMIINCNIRKTASFVFCCRQSLCVNPFRALQQEDETKSTMELQYVFSKYTWYNCLRVLMRFVLFSAVAIPWIIRVYFFQKYEKPELIERDREAALRNMSLGIQWNLTNTLTPFHTVFILCYVICLLYAFMLIVVGQKMKKEIQYVMRKCLRDMREIPRSKAIEWAVHMLLIPCEMCGIFGFIMAGFYLLFVLPIIIIVLGFYCLPTVNLVVRLIVHLLAYLTPHEKLTSCMFAGSFWQNIGKYLHLDLLPQNTFVTRPKHVSTTRRFGQISVLIMCLFTVFAFILLATETITFAIEIFVYTIIGIIMNASYVLKYITLIFMLVLYARDCFKGVSDIYLAFNQSINELVVDTNRKKVEAIARLTSSEQRNTAFQICADNDTKEAENENDNKFIEIVVINGIPKWRLRRLILFLDINDKPYLTKKFFESACYMKTVGVPGPLVYNIRALSRFLCICAFLLFVVLVVVAFGDEFQISGTNQMLATLAGGFLPWVFTNVLFKPKRLTRVRHK